MHPITHLVYGVVVTQEQVYKLLSLFDLDSEDGTGEITWVINELLKCDCISWDDLHPNYVFYINDKSFTAEIESHITFNQQDYEIDEKIVNIINKFKEITQLDTNWEWVLFVSTY